MTHAAGIWEPKARIITSLGREKEVTQKARVTQSTAGVPIGSPGRDST